MAGEALAGALVHIYANDTFVGETRANGEGVWLLEAQKEVAIGKVVIRAETAAEARAAEVPAAAAAEVPFVRYPDSIVLEPLAAALSSTNGDTLAASGDLASPAYVLIRRGDNLWRIARRKYGRGIKYHAIFEANSDHIRNPHWIFPGQVFVIPTRDLSWEQVAQ